MIDINFYENQKSTKFDETNTSVDKKELDKKINIKLNINSEVTNNNIRIGEKEEVVNIDNLGDDTNIGQNDYIL
jgi:hypothetical protein